MPDRDAKDALFAAFAEVGKSLSSGRRVEIVDVLAQGERSVEDVAGEIGQSMANTSQHLRALARAGLVASRRSGARVLYRLAGPAVEQLWSALRDVAVQHVAGLDRLAQVYLGSRSELPEIRRSDLRRRIGKGEVVVLDIRPPAEFAAGHIPGAISVPPADMRRHLRRVPPNVEVVAYCRGPFCAYADEAVRALRRRGVRAARLEDGFPEWRRSNLPVAVGAE